jgi:hypothetical protein
VSRYLLLLVHERNFHVEQGTFSMRDVPLGELVENFRETNCCKEKLILHFTGLIFAIYTIFYLEFIIRSLEIQFKKPPNEL